jgi:hypothetical protein
LGFMRWGDEQLRSTAAAGAWGGCSKDPRFGEGKERMT